MKTNLEIKNNDAKKLVIGMLEDKISVLEAENDRMELTCKEFARDANKTTLESKDLKASFEAWTDAIIKMSVNNQKIEIFKSQITNLKNS